MVQLQREIARGRAVVMDGRDIGTDVLPNATLKVFLTASMEVRARRRHQELLEKGMDEPYEKVLEELRRRDETDTKRAASPLRRAEDAVELDCSEMTLREVADRIVRLAETAIGEGA
jgi:cytidylate kinase